MKKNKNNEETNKITKETQLSDEEIKTINGGMKIIVNEEEEEGEKSWIRTLVDFFFGNK